MGAMDRLIVSPPYFDLLERAQRGALTLAHAIEAGLGNSSSSALDLLDGSIRGLAQSLAARLCLAGSISEAKKLWVERGSEQNSFARAVHLHLLSLWAENPEGLRPVLWRLGAVPAFPWSLAAAGVRIPCLCPACGACAQMEVDLVRPEEGGAVLRSASARALRYPCRLRCPCCAHVQRFSRYRHEAELDCECVRCSDARAALWKQCAARVSLQGHLHEGLCASDRKFLGSEKREKEFEAHVRSLFNGPDQGVHSLLVTEEGVAVDLEMDERRVRLALFSVSDFGMTIARRYGSGVRYEHACALFGN